ncbi:hypothetical protein [Acinetobacter bouvetii]|nr:hypothetical protein [Acinetobacter bouvetii]BCU63342.1 hypothetical protein ACBO_01330 [Acinetobacter bouvetii]
MKNKILFMLFMCLMPFTHAEILKSYPYEILDGEKVSFNYIESDKCNFQRKDLKSSINRILKINKIDLGSGDWMHIPYECWDIKNSKENILLISFINKNKPLEFYVIVDDIKSLGSVMFNLKKDRSFDFNKNMIIFSKSINDNNKNKILILFKKIDFESKGL